MVKGKKPISKIEKNNFIWKTKDFRRQLGKEVYFLQTLGPDEYRKSDKKIIRLFWVKIPKHKSVGSQK